MKRGCTSEKSIRERGRGITDSKLC